MFRFVAASRAIREVVPGEFLPVVWFVTLLGGSTFLMTGLSVAYWNANERRETVLAVVATAFVALAVTLSLKWGIGLPRPPETAQRYVTTDSPVGFPSGHTIAATVVYGGGLVATDRHRTPEIALPVGALVGAVGLSRVVLGVHYLGDVLTGLGVGVALLGVLAFALRRGAAVAFGLAAVCAVPALFVAGDAGDVALALGGSLGGFLGTVRRPPDDTLDSHTERAILTVGGLLFLGGLVGGVEVVEPPLVLAGSAYVLLVFGIVTLPALVGRWGVLAFLSPANE